MVLSKETSLFQHESIKSDISGLTNTVNGAMKETVSIYQRRNDNQTPAKPGRDTTIGTSVTTDNQWEYVMPQPKKNCRFWICEQYTSVDGNKTYSDVRELTNDSYISKWVNETDSTYIDGGALYAHSVTAAEIDASTITVGSLQDGANYPTNSDMSAAEGRSAKIATNYITNIDSNNGITIKAANGATSGSDASKQNYIKLNATGLSIYKGGDSVAEYSDSVRVGKNGSGHTNIASTGMKIYGSDGTVELANIGYDNGTSSSGGTAKAPYFTLGTRKGTIGNWSVSEGYMTTASGYASHAEGNRSTASAGGAHAEGTTVQDVGSTASGPGSHAEGYATTASGAGAHSEGYTATASGNHSHAEGFQTTASADDSHAEGWKTTASGFASHAEGSQTTASGNYSHAGGYGTIANGPNQTAIGSCNVANTTSLFIIGNGSTASRSNALTVDINGNLCTKGNIYVGANADGTGGNQVGQPTYTQVTFPFTPTKSGILLTLIQAQVQGRVYIGLSNAVPSMTDGWTVSAGYINGAHFCNAGSQVNITSSSNMYSCLAYYVTWN